jgi:hypothetical protein
VMARSVILDIEKPPGFQNNAPPWRAVPRPLA